MRADRLLSLLLLLQAKGRTTAQELAERLEVSERTIYRDLDALSMAGIPVFAERGPGGGCTLAEDYRTNLTGLSETEVRTLFMSGARGPLADLGLGKSMEDALLKLLASLPSHHRRDAEIARQRIHLDAAGWNRTEELVPYLSVIQEALWQERRLHLQYRRGATNELVTGLVEPYGLVAKASIWYLVAQSEANLRAFRVSRIHGATLSNETFSYPSNFDLANYWAEWCEQFITGLPRYPVTVRVAPQGIPILPHLFGEGIRLVVEQAPPADSEGWITIPLLFQSLENARGRLLALGSLVEVLEPTELRHSLIQQVEEIVAFYSVKTNN